MGNDSIEDSVWAQRWERKVTTDPIDQFNGFYWRLGGTTEDKSVHARDIFDPRTLKLVAISKLIYNEHQTILVRLEAEKSGAKLVRVAVYSLAQQKSLLQRDYSIMMNDSLGQAIVSPNATIPYLLGESRAYTATNIDSSRSHYVLKCYEFRTQKFIFQSDILGDDWFNMHMKFDNTNADGCHDHSKLVQLGNGMETIPRLSNTTTAKLQAPASGIDVISGGTGQWIQTIPFNGFQPSLAITINTMKQNMVIIGPPQVYPRRYHEKHDLLHTHTVTTLQ
ncbi:hypothetical protein BDV19DRAFT_387660 [Aspergillus venezuelensis]